MSQSINTSEYYTYTRANPSVGALTVSTQLVDSGQTKHQPRYGGRAFSTQKIMNNLPAWMEMRENHESVAQQLTHAWGRHLDDTIQLYNEYRANQFISTADTFDDIHTGISSLSFKEYKVYEPRFVNLLYNSSFSIHGSARLQKPEGWKVEREELDALTFYTDESLFGKAALKLDGGTGDAILKQTREYSQSGGSLNLSMFVQSRDSLGSTTGQMIEHKAGLLLVLHYADGEVKSYGLGFPINTEEKWARASFSVEVTKKLFKYEVIIINRSNTIYIVDLPQLEVGKSATNWSPSELDSPIFLASPNRNIAGAQVLFGKEDGYISKLELLPINTQNEFKDVMIPTRLEGMSTLIDPDNSFNLEFAQEVTYGKEQLATKWVADGSTIRQHSIPTPDVYGEGMLPADLYMGEEGSLWLDTSAADSGDVLALATTVYKNFMLVVTKETYMSRTRHVLKFVKPEKLSYNDTYLQSFGDIEIPLNIVDDTVIRIGISSKIPHTIFIDTSSRKRSYFTMKFDYAYADFRQRRLYCRENYVANGSRLQIV